MATPNLNLDHITETQFNKETTANVTFDGLDNAMNANLLLTLTEDYTLTAALFRANQTFVVNGGAGGTIVLKVPDDIARKFTIVNNSNSALEVELNSAASDFITLAVDTNIILYSDGTHLFNLGTGTGSGSGTGATVTAVTEQTGSFTITDAMLAGNQIIKCNSASAIVITIPDGLTGIEPATFVQTGAGQVSFVDDSVVSFISPDGLTSTRTLGSAISFIVLGANEFLLAGDLA